MRSFAAFLLLLRIAPRFWSEHVKSIPKNKKIRNYSGLIMHEAVNVYFNWLSQRTLSIISSEKFEIHSLIKSGKTRKRSDQSVTLTTLPSPPPPPCYDRTGVDCNMNCRFVFLVLINSVCFYDVRLWRSFRKGIDYVSGSSFVIFLHLSIAKEVIEKCDYERGG